MAHSGNNLSVPQPYRGDEPYCFVSYSHEQSHILNPLISELINGGVRVWYDKGLHIGENYHEELYNRISGCSCFIVFFSPDSETGALSNYIANEVSCAVENSKPILPIYLNSFFPLPGKLKMLGVHNYHSFVLEPEIEQSISGIIDDIFINIPDSCKNYPYQQIPYDEDDIDPIVRRCPVMIISSLDKKNTSDALTAALTAELRRLITSLMRNEDARDALDIALLSPGSHTPSIDADFTPLPRIPDLSINSGTAANRNKLARLASDMLENCQFFYSEIGVTSHIPLVILITDANNPDSDIFRFFASESSKIPAALTVIPSVPVTAAENGLSTYIPESSDGIKSFADIANCFSLTLKKIFDHIGTSEHTHVFSDEVKAAPEACAESHSFRQRTLSQLRKENN